MKRLRENGRAMLCITGVMLSLIMLQPAFAADKTAAVPPARTELITLGTGGGPLIRKARSEPSTLLVVDGTAYLIDCGSGTVRRIVEAGIAPQSIHTIFITHHHPDHDLGLASLMGSDFFSNAIGHHNGHWSIYGPPGTKRMVHAAIKYLRVPFDTFAAEGITAWHIAPSFSAHNIAHAGLVYQDRRIKVTAVENTHYVLMPAKYRAHMKSYSYRVQTPDGVIVFTGDTGPSRAVERLAKGADLLVSEVINEDVVLKAINRVPAKSAAERARRKILVAHMEREHMTPAAVARLARTAGVKAVLLHHFVPGMGRGDARADVRGVRVGFDGQVIAARDLSKYCVIPGADKERVLSTCH